MSLTTRFFEVEGQFRLIPFEVREGDEAALPEGSVIVHTEPIIEEGAIAGLDLWTLVPSDKMSEVLTETADA